MVRVDLDDFVACCKSGRRHDRTETDHFRRFSHPELVSRVENLEAALDRFRKVALSLQPE